MQRRDFLKTSALGMAGAIVMPASAAAASAERAAVQSKNSKINLGFIGLGQQCMYLMSSFIRMDDVMVVAGCDVYDIKRDRFEKRVSEYYKEKGYKKYAPSMYEDYEDLLARKDIDAVVIAVPDHWHAAIAIAACKAGKDVYLEKPMTLTVYEGKQLVKAVRKYNRILQVGSQQRSSEEFIHAATMAREGELGKIRKLEVFVGRWEGNPFPAVNKFPGQTPPAGLNWDKWLGPMSGKVTYFPDIDPIPNAEGREDCWGAWRWYKPTGGGFMTDWGAHMFDIAQWMIGKDCSGPVDIIPPGYSFYKNLTYRYDNGIVVEETPFDENGQGVKIYGEKGWIAVHRGELYASEPKFERKLGGNDIPFEARAGHHRVFIESVKSRIDPNVPVEVGHSSCTMCNIGIIAGELGRPLVWNPIVQKFMDDEEANSLMHYQYRSGYEHLLDV
ncbi:MAG: Gfo/Idh/MocA family oxidoreductase [Bacteroidales bacterium]|nr:Gfo/Idh/MocA family oxidoreductase [Bacteroidales bacterium]